MIVWKLNEISDKTKLQFVSGHKGGVIKKIFRLLLF